MKSFRFGSEELKSSLKVFLWTVGSAGVAMLITLFSSLELPVQYAFVVPVVNTLLYVLKEFFADNR